MYQYKSVSKEAMAKVSCKYALCTAVSKRARMLVDLQQCNEEFKPVIQALEEFEEGTLTAKEE